MAFVDSQNLCVVDLRSQTTLILWINKAQVINDNWKVKILTQRLQLLSGRFSCKLFCFCVNLENNYI